MGDNTIPPKNLWASQGIDLVLAGAIIKGIASCEPIDGIGPVFKVGARTGVSEGAFNPIKADVKMPWDK